MKKFKEEDLPPTDGVWNYYHSDHRWESKLNGRLHNSLGPALIQLTKHDTIYLRAWAVNDQYHRLDGPAIEYADGAKKWYVNGQLHRLDGPAVEFDDGMKMWFIDGVEYHASVFLIAVIKYMLNINVRTAKELEAALKKNM